MTAKLLDCSPKQTILNGVAKQPDPWSKVKDQLTVLKNPMTWGLYEISPAAATWILDNLNHPRNRNLKPNKITAMAYDMKAGLWRVTHQGIAFSDEGWLVDGQNRLHACIKADTPMQSLVFFDVPKEGMVAYDLGTVRSPSDGGKIAGYEGVTTDRVSIAKRMISGFRQNVVSSNQEVIDYIEKHREAIDFSIQCFGSHEVGITSAPVRAAVARAWYTQDRNRLAAFCRILKSGLVDDPATDSVAITLRNYLIRATKAGGQATVVNYQKTERAIIAFMEKESLAQLYSVSEEQFPLPEEQPTV